MPRIQASTVASIKHSVVPRSLNHFQQLNYATISGVSGMSQGDALAYLSGLVKEVAPTGYTVDYATPGVIKLVQSSTPYGLWAAANITAVNPAADATPGGDPDGDGVKNIAEFALNGSPLSGASTGKVVGKVASVGGSPTLVLTLPVRTGASFSGTTEQVSGLIDGVIYRIQGSDELSNWNLAVSEVLGADKTSIESGMPGLDGDWEYRTFQSPGSVTGDAAEFLRAVIQNP